MKVINTGYDYEEIRNIFAASKKDFDEIYDTNNSRYGQEQANTAMYEFLVNYRTDFTTRTNGARSKLEKLNQHYYEINQFLMEYAMASYNLNENNIVLTTEELAKYTKDDKQELKYDRDTIIAAVAIGSAWSPYWMVNLLACNKQLKSVLVESLIEERYVQDKKQALDDYRLGRLVKFQNGKRPLMININTMNRAVDNMIHDDGATYYQDDDTDYSKFKNQEVRQN